MLSLSPLALILLLHAVFLFPLLTLLVLLLLLLPLADLRALVI